MVKNIYFAIISLFFCVAQAAHQSDYYFAKDAVRYLEDSGGNYVGFQAPSSLSADKTYTWPSADGSASTCMQTDASGTLTFGANFKSDVFRLSDVTTSSKIAAFDMASISSSTTRTFTFPNANVTLLGRDDTATVSNKTLDNTTTETIKDTLFTVQDDGDATKLLAFQLSGVTTGTTRTLTVPNASTTIAGTDATQTLTNKTLDNTNTVSLNDTLFTIVDDGDSSKAAKFQASSISTSTTRTYTLPNSSVTLAGLDNTQTFSSKTLDNSNTATLKDTLFTVQDDGDATKLLAFQLSGVSTGTTRTLTVPNASTTIAGTDATQTFTNKTLDNTNTVTLNDTLFTIVDDGDSSKMAKFQASGISTSTTRTLTIPDASTTLVGTDATQTLTNKTLTSPTINTGTLASPSVTTTISIANAGTIALYEGTGGGTNYTAFKAPATLSADKTFTLPNGDGSNGQSMITNASGTLSWAYGGQGDCYIRLHSGNGHGSTATKIRRWTTVTSDVGGCMDLAQSSTAGDKITINATAIYTIDYCDRRIGGTFHIGVGQDADGTTTINSLTQWTTRLAMTAGVVLNFTVCSHYSGRIASGAVISAYTSGDPDSTSDESNFQITQGPLVY